MVSCTAADKEADWQNVTVRRMRWPSVLLVGLSVISLYYLCMSSSVASFFSLALLVENPPKYTNGLGCANFVRLKAHKPHPYAVEALPPDDYVSLVDLKNFSFLVGRECDSNHFLVAVVHSAPGNFEKRRSVRATWGADIKTVFMIGQPATSNLSLDQLLQAEIAEYNDIVQGSFIDSYANMTYKHIMTLKWVTYWCRTATYILKGDDDLFVHTTNLYKFLRHNVSRHGAEQLLLCEGLYSNLAPRSFRSKWRMSRNVYAGKYLPRFCAGAAIVYSPDVVFKLYSKAQQMPVLWIDDLHITGMVASTINIIPTSIKPYVRWMLHCKDLIRKIRLPKGLLFVFTTVPEEVVALWELHESIRPSYTISEESEDLGLRSPEVIYL